MTAYSTNLKATRYIIQRAIDRQNSSEELDTIFLVCGEEGSGKSNVILNLFQIWEEETGKEVKIHNLALNLKELLYSLSTNTKGIHALDEGEELSNLNQFDKIVKITKKCFVVSRANAQIVLISYPNPLKINPYFKEDRAKGIFFCYNRKYVYFFTRKAFRNIREKVSKNNNVKGIDDFIRIYKNYATIIDTAPQYTGHLLKDYKDRKRENINKTFEEAINEIKDNEPTYTLNAVSRKLGVTKKTIYEAIEQTKTIPEWNATHTRMKLREKDIEKLREYLKTYKTRKTITTHTQ